MPDPNSLMDLLRASAGALAISARGIGPFAVYLGVCLVFVVVHMNIYMRITRHDEMKLIREGTAAASVAAVGTMAGLAVPLTSIVSFSGFLLEAVMWAVVALFVQLAAYLAARVTLNDLSVRIERGEMAAGIWIAGISLTAGLLQAVSMKP
jgi:putative membrane protein